jgi:peptide/nickel transport system permease protein
MLSYAGRQGSLPRFVAARLAAFVATLVGASFLIFASLYIAPGNPVSFLIGNRPTTPQARAALRAQYNLDEPFFTRYWGWLRHALHGDFGQSVIQHQSVATLISSRLTTTLLLVSVTFVLIMVVGLTLGGLAALTRGWFDDAVVGLMNVSIATPAFVVSVFLITVFGVELRWFPVFGPGNGLLDRLYHLTLPGIALAVSWWALIGQATRAAIGDELGREHVETARTRGLPAAAVFRRHVFRNALIPITTVSGLSLAGLIAGATIVETAFQLNGIGSLLIQSVSSRDFPVVQAIALILVTCFALVNLVVDTLYSVLDPRVRLGTSAA